MQACGGWGRPPLSVPQPTDTGGPALKWRRTTTDSESVNTPIYLALLVAVAPVVKERVTALLLRDALEELPVARPRLDQALARRAC